MDKTKIRAFADKVYADMAGTMAVGMAYVGVKRGLFRAMAGKGPMTATEVAQASRLQKRYVEEWLKGMTCAGYLVYDPTAGTFQLTEESAFLLASENTDHLWAGSFFSRRRCCASRLRSRRRSKKAAASRSRKLEPMGSRRSIGSTAASMSTAS